jgi:hypothetical protein
VEKRQDLMLLTSPIVTATIPILGKCPILNQCLGIQLYYIACNFYYRYCNLYYIWCDLVVVLCFFMK